MRKLDYRHTQRACYLGYVTQAVLAHLTPLLLVTFQRQYGIPLSQATLLITANFLVQLAVDFIAVRYAGRLGYRTCALIAHVSGAAGLFGLAILPRLFPVPFYGLLTAVTIYAVGGGFMDVIISPIIESCPTENKASSMCLVHSFFCWGMVFVIAFSTVFLQVFGRQNWPVLACLWALLPLFNTFYFARVPIAEPENGMAARSLFSHRVFWLLITLSLGAAAAEAAMSQWASTFAESALGIPKAAGDLAGPCLFAVLMGAARVFYSKYAGRIRLLPLLTGSGVLCVVSYLLAALAPIPQLSLVGCALCGLSVGVLCPGIFSISAERFPQGGAVLFALLSLVEDIGCAGGPVLVGTVSGWFGGELKCGLLAAVVFPAAFVLCALAYRKYYAHPRRSGTVSSPYPPAA